MQSKKSVEVDHSFPGNVDAWPHRVVSRLAVRDHNVEPVGRAALKDDDQALRSRARTGRSERRSRKKTRQCCRANCGQSAIAKENATCNGHEHQPLAFSP